MSNNPTLLKQAPRTTPDELTELELEVNDYLQKRGEARWVHTSSQCTGALNRLVKKGYATYDKDHLTWRPIKEEPHV